MTNKEALAILGTLITQGNSYTKTDSLTASLANDGSLSLRIVEYLTNLKLSYKFVNDIITDKYGSVFYHNNSNPLPKKYNKEELHTSEYDFVEIDEETGRIGIWCEVDGFVSYLDEYKKVWTIDATEEEPSKLNNKPINKTKKELLWTTKTISGVQFNMKTKAAS